MASDTSLPRPSPPESPSAGRPVIVICGFWSRIFAFVVDAVILAMPGLLIGGLFYKLFSVHQIWPQLIGFAIALAYFGILDSAVGQGQTVGNRLTHIRVVDGNGNLISLGRSCTRFLILGFPWLLDLQLACAGVVCAALTQIIVLLQFACGALISYFYLFNRKTRQSLHDLAVGTYVIEATAWSPSRELAAAYGPVPPTAPVSAGGATPPQMWKGHWAILIALVVGFGVPAVTFNSEVMRLGPFPELLSVQQAVQASGKVTSTGVHAVKNWTNGQTTRALRVEVRWKGKSSEEQIVAAEIAAIVLKADPHAADYDVLAIVFGGGFNIGFAHFTSNHPYQHSPQEWQEIIQESRTR